MDEQRHGSDAGDANRDSGVAGDANKPPTGDAGGANDVVASPTENVGGADVAAAISGKVTYSLTVEDAQERFARAHRKVPSIRSLQRYCEAGVIQGIRAPVTYDDGNHAKPWFINDVSLDAYIRMQPMVVLGDAGDATQYMATPTREVGDATPSATTPVATLAAPTPERVVAAQPPTQDPPPIPLSDVLLENARLQERVEGKNEIIKRMESAHEEQLQDLRSERDFLRTDIVDTRALARDFKTISDNILGTFRQIGTKQSEEKVAPGQILYKPVTPGTESQDRPAV